jgi:hypothetical protein
VVNYCDVCEIETKISTYKFDNGVVVCNNCFEIYNRMGVMRNAKKTNRKKDRV